MRGGPCRRVGTGPERVARVLRGAGPAAAARRVRPLSAGPRSNLRRGCEASTLAARRCSRGARTARRSSRAIPTGVCSCRSSARRTKTSGCPRRGSSPTRRSPCWRTGSGRVLQWPKGIVLLAGGAGPGGRHALGLPAAARGGGPGGQGTRPGDRPRSMRSSCARLEAERDPPLAAPTVGRADPSRAHVRPDRDCPRPPPRSTPSRPISCARTRSCAGRRPRCWRRPGTESRWGRHWLDVARYSDTKGYVFTEERRYPYAYTYRDWVVRSFNEDLPYDQFLIRQIAADQLPPGPGPRSRGGIAAARVPGRSAGGS